MFDVLAVYAFKLYIVAPLRSSIARNIPLRTRSTPRVGVQA